MTNFHLLRRLSIFLSFLLLSTLSINAHAGKWDIKLELENTYVDDDDGDDWSSAIEPTIRYSSDRWKTHLEYEKQVDPESLDGKLEWQYDYKFKFSSSELTLSSEIQRDLERDRTRSEITPKWFYLKDKSLKYGIEIEFDYFDSSAETEFDLTEIEIEPTIIWTRKLNHGKFIAELEAPVMRLYSSDAEEDDFELEGYEAIFKYQRKLNKKSQLQFEIKLPYDDVASELEVKPNLSVRYRF